MPKPDNLVMNKTGCSCFLVWWSCSVWVSLFSATEQQLFLRHLPRSRHSVSSHCQPWQPTPLTSISHFIMSHHNSWRLASSALLGVPWRCSALSMLADLDAHKSQRWQPFRAAGASGATGASGAGGILVAAVCSWCGWTKPPHHTTKKESFSAIVRYI